MIRLVLASASPRRKLLLKTLKIPFTVIPSRMFEPPPGFMDAVSYARKLALAKARVVAKQAAGDEWVLGADTVVVHKGEILGKPADMADGIRMLSRLQGTTHRVITGVALVNAAGKEKVTHAASTVTMKRLDLKTIVRLVPKNLDKAGAYAAQEKKDPVIKKVVGSYSNVVGLPLEVVKKLLESILK